MPTTDIADPNFVPDRDVERVWAGRDRHYASGTTIPYDRTRALIQMRSDGGPYSDSVLARAVTRYGPKGRLIRGLIPHWPLLRTDERPWLVAQRLRQQEEDAQNQVRIIRARQGDHEAEVQAILDTLIQRVEDTSNDVRDQQDLDEESQKLLRLLRLMKGSGHAAAAAMILAAFHLMDIQDGNPNGIIEWCRILLQAPLHLHL